MSPDSVDLILRRLDRQAEQLRHQGEQLQEIKADVKETKAQATRTNGRVTELEKWRERVLGAHEALAWRTPLLIGLATAAAGAAAGAYFG